MITSQCEVRWLRFGQREACSPRLTSFMAFCRREASRYLAVSSGIKEGGYGTEVEKVLAVWHGRYLHKLRPPRTGFDCPDRPIVRPKNKNKKNK